jgi:biotin carboxylase
MDGVATNSGERGRRLLVLGAGPLQLGLLEAARSHGIWTAVCDRDPGAAGFALADRRCIVSTEDEPAIERLAAALALDGVISPGTSRPVALAARIAEKLGLPHPISSATAAVVTNKLRRREALAAAGVPQPRWRVVSDGETELGLTLPVIVKPPDRVGPAGQTLVVTQSQLAPAIAAARAASRGGAVLVEEYLDGPEVIVSGFSAEGRFVPLAVTDSLSADGVLLGRLWPSPHAEAAAEVTRRAVDALGIDEGPSFSRLRVSRGGPEVIGVAARLGGGHDTELVEVVSGVDLNRLALASALGRPLAASEVTSSYIEAVGGAAARLLLAPAGACESVEVPQGLKGVVSIRLYHERGHVFGSPARGSDRAGAVVAAGATRHEAAARAEAAVERIRFLTADAEVLV